MDIYIETVSERLFRRFGIKEISINSNLYTATIRFPRHPPGSRLTTIVEALDFTNILYMDYADDYQQIRSPPSSAAMMSRPATKDNTFFSDSTADTPHKSNALKRVLNQFVCSCLSLCACDCRFDNTTLQRIPETMNDVCPCVRATTSSFGFISSLIMYCHYYMRMFHQLFSPHTPHHRNHAVWARPPLAARCLTCTI